MKIAVMQPYIFPYIGYFQMVNAVDEFVFYDDVNFIKQGWINRNRILTSNKDFLFTVPLKNASSFTPINETLINAEHFEKWKLKFLQTIEQSYKKSPYSNDVMMLLKNIFNQEYVSISELAIKSVQEVSSYLKLNTKFIIASEKYQNKSLERQERLIDICKIEKANHYINALGGQELYKKEEFLKEGIRLDFIKTLPIDYKQFNNEFVPWLSIIDVLMFNSKEEVKAMLDNYIFI